MLARLDNVSEKQLLLSLGYVNAAVPEKVSEDIAFCINSLISMSTPKLCYKVLDKSEYSQLLISGKDIAAHLEDSYKIIVFAVTLGASIDALIARYKISDIGRAYVYDACANIAIENVCDNFCSDMKKIYNNITERFSPGYGDYPLEMQSTFAKLLDLERKIGVTVTDSMLLLPQKTVTAIIGIK